MSPSHRHPAVTAPECAGHPWFYACPECGELPRSCLCLRRSVRDRIADAIHFPAVEPELPRFLAVTPDAEVEPPAAGPAPA
jgi:hypothetical protein